MNDDTTFNLEGIDLSKYDMGATPKSLEDTLRERKTSQINYVMKQSFQQNPVEIARVRNLAKTSGMPYDAVATDPTSVENSLSLNQINTPEIVKNNPVLADYLSDLRTGALYRQDVPNLSSLESIMRDEGVKSEDTLFTNLGESLGLSAQGMYEGLKLRFADKQREQMQMLRTAYGKPASKDQTWFQDLLGIPSAFEQEKDINNYIKSTLNELKDIERQQQAIAPQDLNLLEQGTRAGLESMVMNLPAIVATITTRGKSVLPAMGTMALQSYTASYGDARASGLTVREADAKATIDASIEVATEVLPFSTLQKIFKGKADGTLSGIREFMAKEVVGEQVATLTQSFNDYIFGLDEQINNAKSASEVLAIQLERQAVTAIATVVAGGSQSAAASALGKMQAVQTEQMKAQVKGMKEQQDIDSINEFSNASDLRKTDKEAFRQFVKDANDANDKQVFIDSAEVKKYLTDTEGLDMTDPAIELLGQKVIEAEELGVDVTLSVEDFATDMAGTVHFDALRESMTLSADTVAPMQQVKRYKEQENYVQGLVAEAEESASQYVEAQDIYETVREQLIDSGMVSPANAKFMAQVVPAWATSYAVRNGITIQQAYERSGLLIEGPQTGEAARLAAEEAAIGQPTELQGFTRPDAQAFTNEATAALTKNPQGNSATIYTPEDYAKMDLYTIDEGRAGFAIEKGMLISVFKDPESEIKGFETLVPAAIKAGARELEAFDGVLTKNYAKYGFVETGRVPWDDKFAPDGWDYETQGRPDLVSMELQGQQYEQNRQADENAVQDAGRVRAGDGEVRGRLSPLEDAPSVKGINGPIEGLVNVAEQYAADNGIELKRQAEYVDVDPERATRIAEAYEQMENAPNDPAVREAYENLIEQTKAQYEALVAAGYQFWFVDLSNDANLDYISSPWNAMRDIAANKQMGVFPTDEGFGTDAEFDASTNPLLADTGIQWPSGSLDGEMKTVYANDLFRAVHDAFGHGLEGAGFRGRGEENAWQAHVRLFTGSAVGAITSETRGQNSWVNYGPSGEQNQTAAAEDTVFADQKVGLMPEWTWTEGRAADQDTTVFNQSTALRRKTETLKRFGLDPAKTHKTRDVAAALEARQRSKFGRIDDKDYSDEASKRIAKWMVQEVEFEMENGTESGVGWYSDKFQRAIDNFAVQFPELETDKNARDTLTALIAITSDGQKVGPNFRQAIEIYSAYRDNGSFTVGRKTQRQSSVDGNLTQLASLFDEMGVEQTHVYLMETMTVGEMKALAREQGVEFKTAYKVDVTLPRAALILGPKLGAFYANLMGSDGYLTMDRWWSRTFNRYRGNLLDKVIGTEDNPTDARGKKIGLARFKEILGTPSISDDEALAASIAPRNAYADRGYKNPSDIEKAANTIYKAAFENIRDVPSNASDRSFMLDTVERASQMLSRKGQPTSVADIQAILWYYEKRLYGDLGARQTADISYEDAAKTIVSELGGFTGPDIQSELEQVAQAGETIFNQEVEQNQGVTKGYYSPSESLIRLTEAADTTTFLHEFAHFMYEMELTSYRDRPDAANHIGSINNWFKRNGEEVLKEAAEYAPSTTIIQSHLNDFLDNGTAGDKERDDAIRRAVHEQFARGFEKYLMEGKAPSVELRNAFRTFARWMLQVYRSAKGMFNPEEINLDDDIRQIYDRLLATDEQIAAAEARAEYAPMFTDAAMAGMTDEEFEKYNIAKEKVKEKQTETLRDKVIAQLTRQTQKWWKDEMADEVEVQTEEIKKEKVYRAREALKNGDVKMDHATVKDLAGQDVTNKRGIKSRRIPPVLNGMTVKGGEGVHPDEAAALLDYGSGDEMLADLQKAPPIAERAQTAAENAMTERHGDILNDGTIEKEADDAILNAERGALILLELKAISKGTRTPTIDRATLKTLAQDNINKLSFRDIHPAKYRKAEIKAAQESATLLANGDREGAKKAKARQAMNFYLNKAATEARNDTMRIVEGMARYNKKQVRENIMRAENGYWEQIVKILERFEFRKSASMRQVDQKNEAIQAWMEKRMDEDGDALVLSPEVLDEVFKTHWKNVPYNQLKGISDSVKNIEHVARYADKLKVQGEMIDFKKLVQKWTTHIDAKNTRGDKFKSQRTDVNEGRSWGRMAMAQMTKIPFMARWLDGGENGGLSFDILSQPFTDAYSAEVDLMTKHGEPIMNLIQNRSKADQKRHARKVFIPELVDENNDGNLYGNQIVAVALNVGNAGNLRKMLLGEGWANPDDDASISMDNPQLKAVLARMSQSDWELVQAIWDSMDALYPQLAEVHRRTTGLTPPKVDAVPVQTPYGEFKGGYFPVKYDANRSQKAQDNEDKLNAQTESMFGSTSSIQASVNAGATNERTGFYAPIRLSLDVVPAHFQETIHYITHHDAVRQTNKILRNPEVAKSIKESVGPEEFAMLKPWLNDIAKDGREANTKLWWEDALARLRFGTTLASMGFSASTGLLQFLGWSNIAAEVGPKYTYKAVKQILGSPAKMAEAWDFASSNSKILKSRMTSMDREIKNAMNRINSVQKSTGRPIRDAFSRFDNSNILKGVQEASMKHIGYIQTYMVDLPTWYAAYIKELDTSGDEAKAYRVADFTVESIQGSGLTKDLPTILRTRNEANRMFTMFMTFFSALWNMERDLVKGAKSGVYSKTQTAAKLMFLFTIPVAIEMLVRGEFEEDDEPEEALQKYLLKTALYSAASVPFARDVASGIGGEFGYTMTPLAGVLERGIGSSKALADNAMSDGDITMSQAKNATKFIGTALGIPGTGQIWKSTEHLYEVLEEGEEFSTRQLLLGPDREDK